MDTVVDIQVAGTTRRTDREKETAINRAFEAFRQVEQACSRFSPDSELMQVCARVGTPVSVSPLLFEPLKLALEMAKLTKGAFDPAIGKRMEDYGFNRHYLTGQRIESFEIESFMADSPTYRDIVLNERDRTVLLRKPLIIDLGAVAKGFAIDLAARELKPFYGFLVNAGGDLFASGLDESGKRWEIGIQHPERKDEMICSVSISNEAVCTSGGYERKSEKVPGVHHIIDPKTGLSPIEWVSCSVIAPFAMMADAFSTSSILMGKKKGRMLIEQAGLKAIWIASDLQIVTVGGI
ncbi:FAD:protein FMN transferase [Paenibacillus filicis]|uniref:FAD:protein FMN transferase n=1 Tax=Paenibacillus gyeongsangnamensis TaxID=3388067 RepID=A0ABT4QBZ4_9BACL|nr:FAD:protein FMN transferase [Paenibacillus filicis]MCZ8514282.1 FAD:protein FMN transferase [Paenibacillus filicis]